MANKIIHKHSSVVTDGKPKLPTSSQIEYGELAVNYAKDNETISLKNSENEIVEFKSDKYYQEIINENEEITAASLTDLDERVSAVDGKIDENNEAISASLNDLNERIIVLDADLSNKPSYDDLDNYATYDDLSDFATYNDFTGHTGNTSIHVTSNDKTNWNKVSNKLDTSIFNTYTGTTNTTISNLQTTINGKANNSDLTTLRNDFNTLVSGNTKTPIESFKEVTAFFSGVTETQSLVGILAGLATKESVDNLVIEIETNEEITAASLTNLDERVSAVDEKISENNEAISASLNDLNERIIILDADLSNKSDENHTHEGMYATYDDLSDFATEFENNLSGHTSDDSIHVTSSDKTNWNKISNKSDSSHNHGTLKLTGDVTGSVLISSGTSEMTLTATVVNDSHSHSNYSLTGHNHDDRYYTESEIDDFIDTLNGKIDTNKGIINEKLDTDIYTEHLTEIEGRFEQVNGEIENSRNEIIAIIEENEEITAASLTNLDERVSAVDGKISENNEAISASLNDLNERIIILDADLSNKPSYDDLDNYVTSDNLDNYIPKPSTTIGSETQPVYITSGGSICACTAYSSASVSSATKATNAINVGVTSNSANTTHYLTFASGNNNGNKALKYNANLTYYPSSNTFTAGVFCGATVVAPNVYGLKSVTGATVKGTTISGTNVYGATSVYEGDIALSSKYLTLSGGTMTGNIQLGETDDDTDYSIIPGTTEHSSIGLPDKQFYQVYALKYYQNGKLLNNYYAPLKKIFNQSLAANMTANIEPDNYYTFIGSTVNSLTLNLINSNPINGQVLIYNVEFIPRSLGFSLTLPSNVKWANGTAPTSFEVGATYQLSIVNNLAVIAVFK